MGCSKEVEGRERGGHDERQHEAGGDVLGRIQGQLEGKSRGGYEDISLYKCVKVSKNTSIKYK